VFTKLRQSGVEDVNVKDTHYTRDVFSPEIAIEMLEEASRGAIEERHGPTGGPTSSFIGVLSGETTERQVKLLVTGSTTRRNTAKTVEALVEFGQRNCSF